MNQRTYTITIDSDVDGGTLDRITDRAIFGLTEDLWAETDQRWTVKVVGPDDTSDYSWTPDTIGLTKS
jgi:hypothetical protein